MNQLSVEYDKPVPSEENCGIALAYGVCNEKILKGIIGYTTAFRLSFYKPLQHLFYLGRLVRRYSVIASLFLGSDLWSVV